MCHASKVAEPGSVLLRTLHGEPLFVGRNRDGARTAPMDGALQAEDTALVEGNGDVALSSGPEQITTAPGDGLTGFGEDVVTGCHFNGNHLRCHPPPCARETVSVSTSIRLMWWCWPADGRFRRAFPEWR